MVPDFQNIFSGFAPRSGVAVAVSGGSDSLALLFLAHEWCCKNNVKILAITVDHGLRAEAAQEAVSVAALCSAHGICHRTMKWEGNKPVSGIISAARTARYDLLAQAAKEFGADVVLSGHTLDDQAETIAMRLARSDVGSGLSGMARLTLFKNNIWIGRPLLKVRRLALRNYLQRLNVSWIDDPSNKNTMFERVRVRASLDDAQIIALARKADVESIARTDLSRDSVRLIKQFAEHLSPGLLRLDPQFFAVFNAPALHAFRTFLAIMGGVAFLPDRQKSQDLFEQVRAGNVRATLSRTLVDSRKSGVWLLREGRGVQDLDLSGRDQIWDGRWKVRGRAGKTIAAQGLDLAKAGFENASDVPQSLAVAALSLEPSCFVCDAKSSQKEQSLLIDSSISAHRVMAPFWQFMPQFDYDLACAMQNLFMTEELPSLPWNNHIGI